MCILGFRIHSKSASICEIRVKTIFLLRGFHGVKRILNGGNPTIIRTRKDGIFSPVKTRSAGVFFGFDDWNILSAFGFRHSSFRFASYSPSTRKYSNAFEPIGYAKR